MKQFAVFRMEHYYPQGGMGDFETSFDTLEEAEAYCVENPKQRSQYLDIEDMSKYE